MVQFSGAKGLLCAIPNRDTSAIKRVVVPHQIQTPPFDFSSTSTARQPESQSWLTQTTIQRKLLVRLYRDRWRRAERRVLRQDFKTPARVGMVHRELEADQSNHHRAQEEENVPQVFLPWRRPRTVRPPISICPKQYTSLVLSTFCVYGLSRMPTKLHAL